MKGASVRREASSLLWVSLAIAGCSPVNDDARSVIYDVVHSTGAGLWDGDEQWVAELELLLGGNDSLTLGAVGGIAVDSGGRVFVLDSQSQEVMVFGPDGHRVASVGRRGQGPGELAVASGIAVDAGDTLWVVDDGQTRYSRFDPQGVFVDSWSRPILGSSAAAGYVVMDGRLLDWAPSMPDGRFGSMVVHEPLLVGAGGGAIEEFPGITHELEMLASGRLAQPYFGNKLVVATRDDGRIWFADSRHYRITQRTLRGDTTIVITREAAPAPLDEEDRAFLERDAAERQSNVFRNAVAEVVPTRPILMAMAVDETGHLLVLADEEGAPKGQKVDVFASTGEYMGSFELPIEVVSHPRGTRQSMHARGEHLFVASEDEQGAPVVARIRIHR